MKPERLDPELAKTAALALRNRQAGDYDAARISIELANQAVADAERFVDAIEAELG